MKYSLRYIILAFPLFLCLSCVDQMQDKAWNDGDFVLDLSVSCMKTDTKAGPVLWPGIEKYNENKVAYVDWYVFKSATDTGNALLHGRATITQTSGQTEGLKVTEQDMGQYVTDSQRSFYVYTIANMPGLAHTNMPTTLSGLQALELAAGFNKDDFDPQESFVMAAGQSVTFTDAGLTKVTNKLSRLASKVSVNMNVTPAIDQFTILSNGEWKYMRTWYPELASIQVYLSFANSATTVKGDAVSYDPDTFFTYYRTGFDPEYSYTGDTAEQYSTSVPTTTPDWTNDDWRWKVKGSPFYSYPMKWAAESPQAPFIKVILKWTAYVEDVDAVTVDGETKIVPRREKKESALDPILENRNKEFYYKIPLPGTVLNANDWYDLTFNIAILGSTADELPVELAGQYCVMNWSDPEVHAGGELKQGRYLTTASDTYYMYGTDEIEIPVVSSHALATGSAVVTKREVLYDGAWVTTAGTSAPSQVRNLSSRTLSVTAPGDGRSVLKFENELNTAMNAELDCYPMRFTLQVEHSDNQGPAPKTITIMQYPPIYISKVDGGNAMVDGYYGNVGGHYRSTNGSGNSGSNNAGQSVPTPYAPITRYTNTQTQMTVISISSLGANGSYRMPYDRSKTNTDDGGQEYEYIIADPRQVANYAAGDLTPYWRGAYNNGQAVNWTDAQAGKIKIGNTSVPNYIAPKLLVASRWSRTENWGDQTNVNTYLQDYQTATKRCATYQEAGYPAGRWRLPTDAEIIFMAYLQRYQFIDELYSDGAHNVSASGSLIRVRNAQNNREIQYWSSGIAQGGTSQKVSSMRCVYDLWYWGEEPVSGASSTYTIAVE